MWQLHWWLAQGCGKTIIVANHQGEKREHFQKRCIFFPAHFHEPVQREMLSSQCVIIAVTGCHSCLRNIFPQAMRMSNSAHASSYCKADELLKRIITISDTLSTMSREQDFNLIGNITLQQPIKCIFHNYFVILWQLLNNALKMKINALVLYNPLLLW